MKAILFFLLTALGVLAQGPVAPPTTIYGTVRNLAGQIIDDPLYEQIVIYADGVEIGRVPLEWDAERSENYRFDIPNFSVVSEAVHTVEVIRDGVQIPIFDRSFSFIRFVPIQGELRRFDFYEMIDLDLDGIPDDLETEELAPEGDFDGDGLKDFDELLIGTDPFDRLSGVNFEIVRQLPNGDLEVAFDVVAGHVYMLEMTSDLSNWEEVSEFTATSTLRHTTTTTPLPEAGVFWRVGALGRKQR